MVAFAEDGVTSLFRSEVINLRGNGVTFLKQNCHLHAKHR